MLEGQRIKRYQRFSLVFLFMLLLNLFFSAMPAFAAASYTWVSRDTITDPSGAKYLSTTNSRVISSGAQPGGNNTDMYQFVAESTVVALENKQTISGGSWLNISKEDPLTGSVWSASSGGSGHSDIVLTDPNHVAPAPLKIINKGWIVVHLKPDSSVDAKNLDSIVDGTMIITSETSGQLSIDTTPGDQARSAVKVGKEYFVNAIDVSKLQADDGTVGIFPGKYTLTFSQTLPADCNTQQMDNKVSSSTTSGTSGTGTNVSACAGTISGSVDFNLDYVKGGYGKVTVLGSDPVETKSPVAGLNLPSSASRTLAINMTVSFSMTTPFDAAISSMVRAMAKFLTSGLSWVGSTITWLTGDFTADQVIGSKDGKNPGVTAAWTRMRDIGLSLMVIALVIIAFANVVGVDLEQYGLNRMIPRIIISIIMAYGSWIIFVFFFDMCAVLSNQANSILSGGSGMQMLQSITIVTPDAGSVVAALGGLILLFIVSLLVWVVGIVLMFLLVVRVVFLAFLLAVAPLAFILNIMPFSANLYKQWWQEFWKWMFMGPMVIVILALGTIIAGNMGLKSGGTTINGATDLVNAKLTTNTTTAWGFLMGMVVLGATMFLAATLPLQWGGKIMQGWNKAGKWGRDNVLGGKYVKQGLQDFNKARGERGMLRYNEMRSNIANGGGLIGRALTGTNKAQATAQKEAIDKTYESMYGKLGGDELRNLREDGGRKGMIAAKVMKSKYKSMEKAFALDGQIDANGDWNTQDPLLRKAWEDSAKARATGTEYKGYTDTAGVQQVAPIVATGDGGQLGQFMDSDRDFTNDVVDNSPDLGLMVASSRKDPNLDGRFNSSEAGKQSWSSRSKDHIKDTTKQFERIEKEIKADPARGATSWGDTKTANSISEIATREGAGAEERASLLSSLHNLSAYDAGKLVAAADMRKARNDTKDKAKSADRSSPKVNAATDAFDGDQHVVSGGAVTPNPIKPDKGVFFDRP